MKESVLAFDCQGERLIGILSEPDTESSDTGFILIVGGPQYRAGSHRQFTLQARHVARHGFPTLRFDYRGMGDATGEARDFQQVEADITAAIDALLAARPALKRVVLSGLCDAASAALLYLNATCDPRVAGLVLINPWVRSAATLAQTHVKHYYWRRLRQPEFWLKLLRGGVGLTALRTLGRNLQLARNDAAPSDQRSFQERMASAAEQFAAPVLLLLSTDDYTAREFVAHATQNPRWTAVLARPSLRRVNLEGADHTLSNSGHLDAAHACIVGWLQHGPAQ